MPKRLYKPPKNVVQEWPEVFEDIYMSAIPVLYMYSIEIEFNDGRIWEINIAEQLENSDPDTVADKLVDAFREFQDEIHNIVFKVDVEKLKSDIISSTKSFLDRGKEK
jgi:hypothetical protein